MSLSQRITTTAGTPGVGHSTSRAERGAGGWETNLGWGAATDETPFTSMTGLETITYSKDGPVARVVLDRPSVINAYNVQMRDELYQVVEAVRDDPEVRVVVLSGAGEKGFCAGADLTEFGTAPSQVTAREVRWERDIWGLFLSLEKPLVAALHGWVVGSGVEIACLCDVRIASDDSVFRMPEVALGMLPAAGGTQTLPRTIGADKALQLVLDGRRIDASGAKKIGLVHRVVPRDALSVEADIVAQELVDRDPQVLAAAKSAVRDGLDLPLNRGLELEKRLLARLVTTGKNSFATPT